MSTVLVTGGSGFIGGHILLQLLAAGHAVRTTVRDLRREPELRALVKEAGAEAGERLRFFAADLMKDGGWMEAADGCEYVLHVASPFPARIPKHEDELIVPAREGALRVLRAARDAGVKRVVMTSSFVAMGYGHAEQQEPFDERSWTNLGAKGLTAYAKSKTLAERAAWEMIAQEGGGLELAVVNPVLVLGPLLGRDFAASILLVKRMMDGSMPGVPRLWLGTVDVRDVADLHLRAMTNPAAKGERFLAVGGEFVSLREIARILRERLGPVAKKVPRRELPDWFVRAFALVNPEVRQILPELGKRKNATSGKAQRMLGWKPRAMEEAVVSTAESLVRLGLV